jgi:hypothetical protein
MRLQFLDALSPDAVVTFEGAPERADDFVAGFRQGFDKPVAGE